MLQGSIILSLIILYEIVEIPKQNNEILFAFEFLGILIFLGEILCRLKLFLKFFKFLSIFFEFSKIQLCYSLNLEFFT